MLVSNRQGRNQHVDCVTKCQKCQNLSVSKVELLIFKTAILIFMSARLLLRILLVLSNIKVLKVRYCLIGNYLMDVQDGQLLA